MAAKPAQKTQKKSGIVKRVGSYLGRGRAKRGSAVYPTVTRYVLSVAHGRPTAIQLIDVEAQQFPIVTLLKPQDEITVTYGARGIAKIECKQA